MRDGRTYHELGALTILTNAMPNAPSVGMSGNSRP
jgi:hypothetical protein